MSVDDAVESEINQPADLIFHLDDFFFFILSLLFCFLLNVQSFGYYTCDTRTVVIILITGPLYTAHVHIINIYKLSRIVRVLYARKYIFLFFPRRQINGRFLEKSQVDGPIGLGTSKIVQNLIRSYSLLFLFP